MKRLSMSGKWLFASLMLIASAIPLTAALVHWGALSETHLRITRPLFTPVAPLCMAVTLFHVAQGAERQSALRRTLSRLLAGLTVLSLSLSVTGLELGRALDRLTVILVIDKSRSIGLVPYAKDLIDRQSLLSTSHMRDGDRIGTVVFGATAATEDPAHRKAEPSAGQTATVSTDGTDIEAAIRRALAEVPSDSAARIALLSDGVATRGDTGSAAAAALAAHIPIDVVPLEQRPESDVRVMSVTMPPRGALGEAVDLRVVTSSPKSTKADLWVMRDGEAISRSRVTLSAGEDVLRIREKLEDGGLHRYGVEIFPTEMGIDSSVDDNSGSAFVRVHGEASALVLEGDPGQSAFVVNALQQAGFHVVQGNETAVPNDLGGFARYDVVVLSDIPAPKLSSGQIEALASYVRDFGGGLLLLGGDRSFGAGGYGKTPLEEVSPVSFDIKNEQKRASLAEVIGIDISGSMGAMVGDQTKLALANEAAARSAALLGPGDLLGVAHVDTEVHWSVPLAPITDKAAVDRAIRAVSVGGGGIIVPITLEAGYAALDQKPSTGNASLKHLLLFADGDDAEDIASALALATPARSRGITTSVVALGAGKDLSALEQLSKLGGGRFYLIEDATRLPSVFAQETILASRSALVEKSFRVSVGQSSPATRGIDFGEAPALGGYVVTIPKPRSTVALLGPESDPILATWSVGLGRAGAFTSDLKDRWGSAWTTWPGAASMLVETARDLSRKADDGRVRVESDTSGGQLHVRATALGNDGRSEAFRRMTVSVGGPDGVVRTAPLEATGVGTYAADVPLSREGTYISTARDETTGELLGTTGAVLSRGEEMRPTGSDLGLLQRLAADTQGKRRDTLENIFDDRVSARLGYSDISRWLMLVSAFGVLGMVATRRLSLYPLVAEQWARARSSVASRIARARPKTPSESRATRAEVTVDALLRSRNQAPAAKARERETAPSSERSAPAPRTIPPESPTKNARPQGGDRSARPRSPVDRVAAPAPAIDDDTAVKLSTAEILLAKKRKK